MKILTFLFGALTLVCIVLVLIMGLSINDTIENNPYGQGTPCHEMNLSFLENYMPEVSYALPSEVFLDKDYINCSKPSETAAVTYYVDANKGYFIPIHEWGSAFETYPTYIRG